MCENKNINEIKKAKGRGRRAESQGQTAKESGYLLTSNEQDKGLSNIIKSQNHKITGSLHHQITKSPN
jgi:hypothetical protein